MNIFLTIIISLSILLLSYAWFIFCYNEKITISPKLAFIKKPISVFIFLGFLGCIISYFIVPTQKDMLYTTSISTLLVSFASAIALYILSQVIKSQKLLFVTTLAFCTLNILLLPSDFNFSNGLLPNYVEQIILILAWSLFAFLYNNLNDVDGVLNIQSISINVGLILMYIIGILPALYGYYAGSILLVLIAFNFFSFYPAKLHLTDSECRIIGFIIGWLCILATLEGNISCVAILAMYYIYEITIATLKKLTFKTQYKTLKSNTFYSKIATLGISPRNICELISRINIMLILLAGFQIYSPNSYTIVIISFFMVFWITARATSSENSNNHILITGSLLSFLKKGFKETKNPTDKDN